MRYPLFFCLSCVCHDNFVLFGQFYNFWRKQGHEPEYASDESSCMVIFNRKTTFIRDCIGYKNNHRRYPFYFPCLRRLIFYQSGSLLSDDYARFQKNVKKYKIIVGPIRIAEMERRLLWLGFYFTTIVHLAVSPFPVFAVIVVVPFFLADTFPVLDTVATVFFDEV